MRGLLGSVASIIRVIVAAAIPVIKWCAKSGTWVVDHTARATIFAMDKMGDLMAGMADLIGKAATIPGRLFSGLLGGGGSLPMPPRGNGEAAHDRRVAQVEKAIGGLRSQRDPLAQVVARQELLRPRDVVGDLVHRYASADPVARLAIDLDMLPPHIRAWLVSRNDATLQRLAKAGPAACGEIFAGRRRIVGIERPGASGLDVVDVDSVLERSAATPYLNRIALAKGGASVLHS